VRGLVRSADIAAFVQRHGEAVRDAALRHCERAPAEPGDALPLDEAVVADGAACLAAWIDLLPPGIAARLRLRVADVTPDARHRAQGPALIRLLANEAAA
jgi:hypothetical protein